MRYQGKITHWKDDQGFGFVIPNGGGEKAFVHIKAFSNRSRRPNEGDLITYVLTTDEKHRLSAQNIRFTGEHGADSAIKKTKSFDTIFAFLFCLFLTLLVLTGRLPFAIIGLYLIASTIAFVAYAIDKSAAQKNRWRTQESTLHLLALVGGWPGALLAQKTLRHKSKKVEFKTVFAVTVVINCLALGWLLTTGGTSFLNTASALWPK
ncbi:MAG: DUF1294 domain-containing protein [Methylotenera sp.]|nr:DUF1294 domain-containing protein [Methylotenera sp.]MDD4927061.1 DUF1294 domain-containing protein [Methylotenera sp.]NOS96040.1 DUF1294 domain-containing protein [Methylotenera sp.]